MTLNELLELKYTDAEKYELALDEYYSSKGLKKKTRANLLEIHDRYDMEMRYISVINVTIKRR